MSKKLKGGPFGILKHPFCHKTPKKLKGGPLGKIFFRKKSRNAEKKLKGGPFSLVRYCMLRGKPFYFSSLGQRVQFGVFLKFCRTFGRTILVNSGGLKKLTKSNDYSRLFSRKSPTKIALYRKLRRYRRTIIGIARGPRQEENIFRIFLKTLHGKVHELVFGRDFEFKTFPCFFRQTIEIGRCVIFPKGVLAEYLRNTTLQLHLYKYMRFKNFMTLFP